MTHEEIIKRNDGTQYKIIVIPHSIHRFIFAVYKLDGNIWKPCPKAEVTKEEIYKAKLTLWEQMKPEL